MITLRPYQERLLDAVRAEMRHGHHAVLAVAPTGSGKTIIAAELAHRVTGNGKTIWFGVHRDFLIEQTSGSFTKVGVPHGFIAAGRPEGVVPAMVVAIDTLRSRLHRTTVKPDIFVFDEAHHCRAESWLKVWDWLGPQTRIIGLTATPQRLDGAGLGVIPGKPGGFSSLVQGPTTADLMRLGMLSGYRAFAPSTPDLSGVRTVAGDYDAHQLSEAVERSVIVGDVVDHWRRHAPGRKSVYFAVNIGFSKRLAEAFEDAGVPALHIDGTTPSAERVAAAKALAEGRVRVLVNVALMGEGFDLAAVAGLDCNVECVGLVRPTQSLALHL
ncbi:MAG: DEAD/DEAH box helicase family protein, partial [Allosphingosinicella sp.]